MTDDCMGCRVPGYSHAAYCPEGRVEDLRSRLAEAEDKALRFDLDQLGIALREKEAVELVELRQRVAEAQEEADRRTREVEACYTVQRDLKARLAQELDGIKALEAVIVSRGEQLAEAERSIDTLLGMIRHQRDVLRECLPYLNESMAGRRPGRSADDIRASVKALTADSASGEGEK